MLNYYELLGIDRKASIDQINLAIDKMVSESLQSEEDIDKLKNTLLDPKQKALYDQKLEQYLLDNNIKEQKPVALTELIKKTITKDESTFSLILWSIIYLTLVFFSHLVKFIFPQYANICGSLGAFFLVLSFLLLVIDARLINPSLDKNISVWSVFIPPLYLYLRLAYYHGRKSYFIYSIAISFLIVILLLIDEFRTIF